MSSVAAGGLQNELTLISRFTTVYRRRLGSLIDRLNQPTRQPSDMECIRACVEAVNLVPSPQQKLAETK